MTSTNPKRRQGSRPAESSGRPRAAIAARTAALALIALALAGLPSAAAAAQPADPPSLAAIEEEVMCTVCGVPLSMAREAPAAKRQRAYINELIADGLDEQQIKDRLVVEYGKGVLIEPPGSGFDLTAWVVPIAGFLFGAAVLALLLVRWRRRPAEHTDPDPAGVARLSPADAELVDEALRERD